MEPTSIENIKASKQALRLHSKMSDAIDEVTQQTDIDWSHTELLDAAYKAMNSDNPVEDMKRNLTPTLHGSKADVAKWVLYISEYYRQRKGFSPDEMLKIFHENHIQNYLADCYPALHTVSESYTMRMIDDIIEQNKKNEK